MQFKSADGYKVEMRLDDILQWIKGTKRKFLDINPITGELHVLNGNSIIEIWKPYGIAPKLKIMASNHRAIGSGCMICVSHHHAQGCTDSRQFRQQFGRILAL